MDLPVGSDDLRLAAHEEFFKAFGSSVFQAALEGFEQRGRGVVCLFEAEMLAVLDGTALDFEVQYTTEADEPISELGWDSDETRRLVESYDPQTSMIALVLGVEGDRFARHFIAMVDGRCTLIVDENAIN
jgi:hypothetical protein